MEMGGHPASTTPAGRFDGASGRSLRCCTPGRRRGPSSLRTTTPHAATDFTLDSFDITRRHAGQCKVCYFGLAIDRAMLISLLVVALRFTGHILFTVISMTKMRHFA